MALGDNKGGFRYPGYNPLKVADAPTGISAEGDSELDVSFTAPADVGGGAITLYQASTTTGVTATSATSPVTLSGLTNGTLYNVRVWAINGFGPGPFGTGSGTPVAVFQRAVFAGGNGNVMDYVDITTAGNATDFGDLLATNRFLGAFSSSTRGVWAGGDNTNVIQYATIASAGNTTDFGDATVLYRNGIGGCSNSTRGIFGGGYQGGYTATLNYVTIATTGNAVFFGNLTVGRYGLSAVASPTRAIFADGEGSGGFKNILDYHSISSTGNFSDFGDTTVTRRGVCSSSNATRGIFGGSSTYPGSAPYSNVLDYITMATTGNAIDFGDATALFTTGQSAAGLTKALFSLGNVGGSYVNTIDQVTIATTGNATDFGDLTVARSAGGACSSAHGGI